MLAPRKRIVSLGETGVIETETAEGCSAGPVERGWSDILEPRKVRRVEDAAPRLHRREPR
jgi:hypothetical protein